MQHDEFEQLVNELSQVASLPLALDRLIESEDEEVSSAALSLKGQFALAEMDGEKRIYHVTLQENDEGVEEEFVEHVMNEGEDVLVFISWFFYVMFEVKHKETYEAVGRVYQPIKRK